MVEVFKLKKRKKSIESIKKATKAQQIITAARIASAKHQMKAFSEFFAELKSIVQWLPADQNVKIPTAAPVALVVITSNRGFCGGFNTNVITTARIQAEKLIQQGKKVTIYAIGRKGGAYFSARCYPMLGQDDKIGDTPTLKAALDLINYLRQEQQADRLDEVYLIYNQYQSVLVQLPMLTRILPFEFNAHQSPSPPLIIFEPDTERVSPPAINYYLGGFLLSKCIGSLVGELSARLVVTKNAVDNSDELISQLNLQINKIRQANITSELTGLSSNFEVLKEEL
ncbi:MAG: ATP synthase F1 subunit gamma [Candidatus Margulisiibacteriota bacterium]